MRFKVFLELATLVTLLFNGVLRHINLFNKLAELLLVRLNLVGQVAEHPKVRLVTFEAAQLTPVVGKLPVLIRHFVLLACLVQVFCNVYLEQVQFKVDASYVLALTCEHKHFFRAKGIDCIPPQVDTFY